MEAWCRIACMNSVDRLVPCRRPSRFHRRRRAAARQQGVIGNGGTLPTRDKNVLHEPAHFDFVEVRLFEARPGQCSEETDEIRVISASEITSPDHMIVARRKFLVVEIIKFVD